MSQLENHYDVIGRKIPFNKEDFYIKYKQLSAQEEKHILLESGRGGRYSMVGLNPSALVYGKDDKCTYIYDNETLIFNGNPLENLRKVLSSHKGITNPHLPPFQGGWMGYFTYDCFHYIEKIQPLAQNDLDISDLYFMFFQDVYVFDEEEGTLWAIAQISKDQEIDKDAYLDQLLAGWTTKEGCVPKQDEKIQPSGPVTRSASMSEEEFEHAVIKIQDYITAGDVFQVNLAVRQSVPLLVKPIEIYDTLREINPSPYMGYMSTDELKIVCGSPELLVKKQGNRVSTRPIAGTRSRGSNEDEDLKLAMELIQNEKEKAEHVMLVDLERNDLGRVCAYGTVEVDEFMVIEKYSHVMHIVSNVKGELNPKFDGIDIIKAMFPGGTITGAPKVRTMEIIEELEPVRRGLYTGAIGWFGLNGDLEFNIVIRTMVVKDGVGYIQAGAGIVIDSVPKREYKESLKKAAALWRAKEIAEAKKGGKVNDLND